MTNMNNNNNNNNNNNKKQYYTGYLKLINLFFPINTRNSHLLAKTSN